MGHLEDHRARRLPAPPKGNPHDQDNPLSAQNQLTSAINGYHNRADVMKKDSHAKRENILQNDRLSGAGKTAGLARLADEARTQIKSVRTEQESYVAGLKPDWRRSSAVISRPTRTACFSVATPAIGHARSTTRRTRWRSFLTRSRTATLRWLTPLAPRRGALAGLTRPRHSRLRTLIRLESLRLCLM